MTAKEIVMTRQIGLLMVALLCVPAIASADSHGGDVVSEVKKAIEDNLAKTRETKMDDTSFTSGQGSYEFWSSGGLLKYIDPKAEPGRFEVFDIDAKHIEVVPLAEDVALAMFYNEGVIQPEGFDSVSTYRTRVMMVLVKEDGVWKQRAGHWSPLAGGSGTSQTID